MRGQKSRKGEGAGVRPGFEGGQTALYRRLPKLVGKPMKSHKKTKFSLIKISMLNQVEDGSEVDFDYLFERGFATKVARKKRLFKVVGGEELTVKNLVVRAHGFTASARAAIEENGGRCVLMSRTKPITIEEAAKERKALRTAQNKRLKERRALKAKSLLAKAT
jgi:large subunit ribosomal protein L15